MGHDQCHSSAEEGKPLHSQRPELEAVGTTGQKYWRGLEELADTRDFRDFLEREFPAGASELSGTGRRNFLKLMGASVALAGAATLPGCRRPEHKILAYSARVPENVIPGKPLYYASSMPLPGGGAEGLLITTNEGRPTKIEGNPLHPINQGKSSVWSQASILNLYDPDRLKNPEFRRDGQAEHVDATWDDFAAWSTRHFSQFDATKGAGLALIVEKKTSPTRDRLRDALKAKWPQATFIAYDATENTHQQDGLKAACGAAAVEVLDLSKAKTIVSFDRDFVQGEPMSLVYARDLAASRRMLKSADTMSRLYVLESMFTSLGSMADHRAALSPSQISAAFAMLARKLAGALGTALSSGLAGAVSGLKGEVAGIDKMIDAIAADLLASRGASVLVAGRSQPAWVHALCAALNTALNASAAASAPVKYVATDAELAVDSARQLAQLRKDVESGKITTLVCIETNPLFNGPDGLGLEKAIESQTGSKKTTLITLNIDDNETVHASTWRLNAAHYLEAWNDATTFGGTLSVVQPMIAPLYAGRSDIELLALIIGQPAAGYDLVRATWQARLKLTGEAFEKAWRRTLWDGLAGVTAQPQALSVDGNRVGELVVQARIAAAPTPTALEASFFVGHMGDGRWINNAWLQELPEPASRTCWDNAGFVSPATLKALGLDGTDYTDKKPDGPLVKLKVDGREMTIVLWAVPGVADNTVVLPVGWGRRVTGLVGMGTGFDCFAFKPASQWVVPGVAVENLRDRFIVASTQLHGSMEGRALLRQMDMAAMVKHGDKPFKEEKDTYGRMKRLSLAEQLSGSELTHMPAGVSAYVNPYNASKSDVAKAAPGSHYDPQRAGKQDGTTPVYAQRAQWGMSIDLGSCTGCNVCTIACQAENNIPVVGKAEVIKGREMQWIRIDRYFVGDDRNAPEAMAFQPVACVHCENAPCEVVCPVNATVHGPEGHNYMVYNRCIGTRYCANNCPYKVRRFNFFEYGVTKFNGGLDDAMLDVVPDVVKNNLPSNQNLIPPRLRAKLDEIQKLAKNPNVTVRSRGVMEKCTYCIQRTNEAKIEYKLKMSKEGKPYDLATDGLPDKYVQTACQQACPTNAISFGDILDPKSEISQMREHTRTYALLGYLNVRPRTTYMASVKNPSPMIRAGVEDPFGHGSHDGHGGDHHGDHKKAAMNNTSLSSDGTTYVDRRRALEAGYRVSLSVLGGSGGAV
jgi:MoCo/4Fe-4S cofactor protein with predicted Tat translocation signal